MKYLPRIFASPSRYIQGKGLFRNVYKYLSPLGSKFLLIASKGRLAVHEADFCSSITGNGAEVVIAVFGGEVTMAECDRISKICTDEDCDCIVGLGGGKTLDAAKQVAANTNSRLLSQTESLDLRQFLLSGQCNKESPCPQIHSPQKMHTLPNRRR